MIKQKLLTYIYQFQVQQMSSYKQTRPRSMSAKSHSTRQRPFSGVPSNAIMLSTGNLKTQLITSIYYNRDKSPGKKNSSKNLIYPGVSTQQLAKFKKSMNIPINKSKQELYQENMQLKKQINKITEQFSILRAKTQSKSKKVVQKNKKLDMQFQKQIFWTGTKTHMIQGIKFQYQKLKKQHIEQTKKYNELKTALLDSKIPQYKIYSEAVENQNKRLVEKLNKIYEKQQLILQTPQGQQRQISKILIAQAQQNNKNLQKKLVQLDTQLRNANQNIKDKEKKIQFMEKLIIQKDNREYHIGRKLKKTQKEKNQAQQQITQLKSKIEQQQKQQQKQLGDIQQKNKKQKSELKSKFNNEINERNNIIQNLQEQNKLLQNTVNKLRMSASMINNSNNPSHVNTTHQKKSNVNSIQCHANTKNQLEYQISKKQQKQKKEFENYDSVLSKDVNEDNLKQDKQEKFRVVQRANKKHSQNSKKSRKVQFHEIQHIGETLRYRMINQNIDSTKMKDYFSYKKQSIGKQSEKQPQWNNQYICMAEAEKILFSYPFNLDKQSCFLLARYIIEDCHEQFVYTDAGNQNTRQVAKSILKAIVGSYNLIKQQTKLKAQQFMQKYETNLQSALRTYNPSGKVTKKRFLDTINGLGVEVTEDVTQYLLAKVIKNSKNLQQIQFNHLFQKVKKN